MKRNLIFGVLCLYLVGCAVGPKYTPPEVSLSDDWSLDDIDRGDISQVEVSTKWWEVFKEELLTKYINQAAEHNYSVLIAESNIKQARALKLVATSQLIPHLSLDLAGSKTYFSKNGPILSGPSLAQGVSPVTGLPFVFQFPQMQSLYNALIDSSWEIDVFGQIRNEIKVTEGLLGASIDEKNNILVSIFAEIAMNYMQLRSAQQMGKIVEHNIRLYEEWLSIEGRRKETGFSKTLDVIAVESQLAIARSELPANYAKVYQNIYAISILTGEFPEKLLEELLPIESMPEIPEQVAVGLRSDLIRRRPDISKAERILSSATANVGVAVAAFLPKFTLSGDIGFQSLKLVNLFNGMSKTWTIGGDINMPLFQGGRLIGNLRISEAQAMAAAQSYHQTVLEALEETESALAKYKGDFSSYKDLRIAAQKDAETTEITNQQFKEGYVNAIHRLQNEIKLNATLELEVASQRDTLVDLVALYKALGGGFEPFSD
jgi:outer membrane protein, multidrug efflux system